MDELIAFISARLDEDEAVAKAALLGFEHAPGREPEIPAGRWQARYHEVMMPQSKAATIADCGMANVYPAAHIARHDPARVLRDAEADRKLIAAYEASDYGQAFESQDGPGLYLAVRIRAERFSDNPDYRQEWALEVPASPAGG